LNSKCNLLIEWIKLMKIIKLLSLACVAGFGFMQCESKNNIKSYMMQEGDFLFQDGDCGALCEAIKTVTFGVDGLDFSHIGIIKKNQSGNWVVLEAISDGVVETMLENFLQRNIDEEGKPKVVVGRLKDQYHSLITDALRHGEKYLGKPYDHVFDIDNDAYYCSELIYYMFKEANQGEDVFLLEPMTFIDPASGATFPVWEKYYRELGAPIPENAPGLNPGSISRSDKLNIFYPYSQFNHVIRRAG
jgi:uncharacterized protein YycO